MEEQNKRGPFVTEPRATINNLNPNLAGSALETTGAIAWRKWDATNKKPFDLVAKGLSAGNWLPVVDEFRNFYLTSEDSNSKSIEELLALAMAV